MQTANLLNLIALGEDSQHQFKSNVTRSDALAQEMVAFSNSHGGYIIIGVRTYAKTTEGERNCSRK